MRPETKQTSHPAAILDTPLQVDFLGESTEGNLHLVRPAGKTKGGHAKGIIDVLGLTQPEDVFSMPLTSLRESQQVPPPCPPSFRSHHPDDNSNADVSSYVSMNWSPNQSSMEFLRCVIQ